jgi:hypothetical protein
MADKKISELDVSEAVNGGELLLLARDVEGVWSNESVSAATLAAYVAGEIPAPEGEPVDSAQNILATSVFH